MPFPEFTERELDTIYEWAEDARNSANAALERYRRAGSRKPENTLPIDVATKQRDMAIAILKKITAPTDGPSTSSA